MNIPGFVPRSRDDLAVKVNWVGTRYFDTMGIPILTGRDFTAADENNSQKVAVVSETMASFYFPGQNPLGKRFDIGPKPAGGQIEIVWSSERPIRPEPYPATRTPVQWNAFLDDLYKGWGGRWFNPGP